MYAYSYVVMHLYKFIPLTKYHGSAPGIKYMNKWVIEAEDYKEDFFHRNGR
jgi:hypothetical protein